jgi:hypothetical protein
MIMSRATQLTKLAIKAGSAILLSGLVVHAGCSRSTPHQPAKLKLEPLTLPAAEPSLAPQLTVNGDSAILSWIETQGQTSLLKFAQRTASGWSEPRTAASGTDWFVNWADVPSVLRLDDGTLAAHWLQNTDVASEAYDLRIVFSKDAGVTWTSPVSPHHDGTKTEHGFASLFQGPGAGLGLVWLDGRALESDGGMGNNNMSLRAAVFDRNGAQLSESLVDDRVCDCCPTAVAITSDGPIVAFRDRSATDIRDIAVARTVAGRWSPPTTVHDDGWQIAACPVNGPAVTARGRMVAVAWMTGKDDKGRAFAAFSKDGGATFGAPIRLDDSASLGRVGIELLDDDSAIASWVEFADQRTQLQIRWIDSSGARGPAQTVVGLGGERSSGHPRLGRRGDELLIAWTETSDGRSAVRTAVGAW